MGKKWQKNTEKMEYWPDFPFFRYFFAIFFPFSVGANFPRFSYFFPIFVVRPVFHCVAGPHDCNSKVQCLASQDQASQPDFGAYRGFAQDLFLPSNAQNCRHKRKILEKGTFIFCATLVCSNPCGPQPANLGGAISPPKFWGWTVRNPLFYSVFWGPPPKFRGSNCRGCHFTP